MGHTSASNMLLDCEDVVGFGTLPTVPKRLNHVMYKVIIECPALIGWHRAIALSELPALLVSFLHLANVDDFH